MGGSRPPRCRACLRQTSRAAITPLSPSAAPARSAAPRARVLLRVKLSPLARTWLLPVLAFSVVCRAPPASGAACRLAARRASPPDLWADQGGGRGWCCLTRWRHRMAARRGRGLHAIDFVRQSSASGRQFRRARPHGDHVLRHHASVSSAPLCGGRLCWVLQQLPWRFALIEHRYLCGADAHRAVA